MPHTHTRLLVVNFSECFRFYRDVLQLTPHWGDEADSYASFTNGQNDMVVLALFQREAMAAVLGTGALPLHAVQQDRSMLIFGVEDVDEAAARIKATGMQFVMEPTNFPDWGYRGAFLRDPDGNLIELSGALAPDLWTEGLRAANEKWKS